MGRFKTHEERQRKIMTKKELKRQQKATIKQTILKEKEKANEQKLDQGPKEI